MTPEQEAWHREKRLRELERKMSPVNTGWERMTLRSDEDDLGMPPYPPDSLWDKSIGGFSDD